MKIIKSLPTLYSLSSAGKIKQWSISVEEENNHYYLNAAHGYLGQTITSDYSSAIVGKNFGKKNETSDLEQAVFDATSKWKHKLDQNYSETIPEDTASFTKLRPMLAQEYSKRKHYIKFPCYVQPKLDGVRALATYTNNSIQFTSRGDKVYSVIKHLQEALMHSYLPANFSIDGEIFHPELSLQQIVSAVKKENKDTHRLQYWIFDVAATSLTFEKRLQIINQLKDTHPMLVVVPTMLVNDTRELLEYHKEFSLSHEGTMIRNAEGVYKFDYRSNDLLKLKDFQDAEFKIIGGKEASGNDEGTVIFKCVTDSGREFDVRPRGTREKRKEWFSQLNSLIGKNLTVRFQQFSDEGTPIFPVGIDIRDYE